METYQVNILVLTNAEGTFNKLGDGTLVIDDLRDEVRVTGSAVARWIKVVLIILSIILVPMFLSAFSAVVGGPDAQTQEHGYIAAILMTIAFPSVLILLLIYRKKILPYREVAVRFSQSDLGLIGEGINKHEGSVVICDVPGESGESKKWVSVRPSGETEGKKIIDACTKLRDG